MLPLGSLDNDYLVTENCLFRNISNGGSRNKELYVVVVVFRLKNLNKLFLLMILSSVYQMFQTILHLIFIYSDTLNLELDQGCFEQI